MEGSIERHILDWTHAEEGHHDRAAWDMLYHRSTTNEDNGGLDKLSTCAWEEATAAKKLFCCLLIEDVSWRHE